jgi:DNA (cytosine-5)-methyltransferase 1
MNYYNEFDKKAVAWLRALIADGLIPLGEVDERSIVEVQPADLRGFTQCHFFAGIGGWPLALQLAGWPASRPVWTGSCPCQPFSAAGKRKGTADHRHLWPEFARLIGECRPATVFGEQVASKDGREWLAGVFADLEGMGYAAAGADLCAAGTGKKRESERIGDRLADLVAAEYGEHLREAFWDWWYRRGLYAEFDCYPGAPHIRQRLFWVADGGYSNITRGKEAEWQARDASIRDCIDGGPVGPADGAKQGERRRGLLRPGQGAGGLSHAGSAGSPEQQWRREQPERPSPPGFWSDYDIIPFRDGKARRIESGLEPLAHGVSGFVAIGAGEGAAQAETVGYYHRVTALKGFGNAILPQVAARYIISTMEAVAL